MLENSSRADFVRFLRHYDGKSSFFYSLTKETALDGSYPLLLLEHGASRPLCRYRSLVIRMRIEKNRELYRMEENGRGKSTKAWASESSLERWRTFVEALFTLCFSICAFISREPRAYETARGIMRIFRDARREKCTYFIDDGECRILQWILTDLRRVDKSIPLHLRDAKSRIHTNHTSKRARGRPDRDLYEQLLNYLITAKICILDANYSLRAHKSEFDYFPALNAARSFTRGFSTAIRICEWLIERRSNKRSESAGVSRRGNSSNRK